MRTITQVHQHLDPDACSDALNEEEAQSIVNGKCPGCSEEGMYLQTSGDFTDFMCCDGCKLVVHCEVLEIVLGKPVERTRDVIKAVISAFVKPKKETT